MKRVYRKPVVESDVMEQTSLACVLISNYTQANPFEGGDSLCTAVKEVGALTIDSVCRIEYTRLELPELTLS